MKRLPLLLPLLLLMLAVTACGDRGGSPPPADLEPIGDGLKVIGFALVGAAVVITVGRWIK